MEANDVCLPASSPGFINAVLRVFDHSWVVTVKSGKHLGVQMQISPLAFCWLRLFTSVVCRFCRRDYVRDCKLKKKRVVFCFFLCGRWRYERHISASPTSRPAVRRENYFASWSPTPPAHQAPLSSWKSHAEMASQDPGGGRYEIFIWPGCISLFQSNNVDQIGEETVARSNRQRFGTSLLPLTCDVECLCLREVEFQLEGLLHLCKELKDILKGLVCLSSISIYVTGSLMWIERCWGQRSPPFNSCDRAENVTEQSIGGRTKYPLGGCFTRHDIWFLE